MARQLQEKKSASKAGVKEDLFAKYVQEMEQLVDKYPEDPNKTDLSEEKLSQLINDLDHNWMAFRKRWQSKISIQEAAAAQGKIKKDKKGIHHLIIKSEATGKNIIDLVASE